MKRNRELFEKIAAQIEETPDRYDQNLWIGGLELLQQDTNVCDTTCCIAGWAIMLTDGIGWFYDEEGCEAYYEGEICAAAGEKLGLTDDEAATLFGTNWMESRHVSDVAEELRRIGNGAEIKCANWFRAY